jgi:Isocitrate/isopropylmalate dehydrogenase
MAACESFADCSHTGCSCCTVLLLTLGSGHMRARAMQIVDGVDIMVVRELTGDVYFGEPKVRTLHWALCLYMRVLYACLRERRLQ